MIAEEELPSSSLHVKKYLPLPSFSLIISTAVVYFLSSLWVSQSYDTDYSPLSLEVVIPVRRGSQSK